MSEAFISFGARTLWLYIDVIPPGLRSTLEATSDLILIRDPAPRCIDHPIKPKCTSGLGPRSVEHGFPIVRALPVRGNTIETNVRIASRYIVLAFLLMFAIWAVSDIDTLESSGG